MTPAVRFLDARGIGYRLLRYEIDATRQIGLEAAAALDLAPAQVFKTLVVELDDARAAIAVIPVASSLDLKALSRAAGARSARLAERRSAERATGYVIGGISPFGLKRALPTFVCRAALGCEHVYVSAGRRGYELEVAPDDLVRACAARVVEIARSG